MHLIECVLQSASNVYSLYFLKQTSDLLPSTTGMADKWLYVAREFIAMSVKCLIAFRVFSLCFKKMFHAPVAPFTSKGLLLIYQDEE